MNDTLDYLRTAADIIALIRSMDFTPPERVMLAGLLYAMTISDMAEDKARVQAGELN